MSGAKGRAPLGAFKRIWVGFSGIACGLGRKRLVCPISQWLLEFMRTSSAEMRQCPLHSA